MSTLAQLLLAVVVCVLTFLITFAAIQVFHLLHDLRVAAKKLNSILDKPVTATSLASDLALRQILRVPDQKSPVTPEPEIAPDRVLPINHHDATPSSRRFFHKSGSPLRS